MSADPRTIDRFEVARRLGEGGMGVVYLARDPHLERLVAIKLIRHGFENADVRERFVREARAVASLRHSSIVTIFESGEHEGQPFIVMEYVNGRTLSEMIRTRGPLSLGRRLQLVADLCRGLHQAHRAGIVHRDVKPANIMVDGEGSLRILDFGLARSAQPSSTRLSVLAGTPQYMSPEQVEGRPITRASDIFSTGLVLYELLSYRPAFQGDSEFAIMSAVVHGQPTRLSALVAELDPRIIQIVDRAIEKEPDHRYPDMLVMVRDIERVRHEIFGLETDDLDMTTLTRGAPEQIQEVTHPATERVHALGALERARMRIHGGDFESAVQAADETLEHNPADADALRLKSEALQGLDIARRHYERERRAQSASADAARVAVLGLFDEALRLLGDPVVADHPIVQESRASIEAQRVAIDRLKAVPLAPDRSQGISEPLASDTVVVAKVSTPTIPPGIRWILVPPDIVAVKRRSPPRVKTRAPWRPRPDGAIGTERAGDRDWFSDKVFVEARDGHSGAGYGTSIGVHIALAALLIVFVVMRADKTPFVKNAITLVMPAVMQMPTVPNPTKPSLSKPLSPAPAASPRAPSPLETNPAAAPIEAPSEIKPELDGGNGIKGGIGGAEGSVGGVTGGSVPPLPKPTPPPSPSLTPPPPPATPPAPVRVGGRIRAPMKIKDALPVYPENAMAERVQGVVIVEATIGLDGKVTETKVVHSIPLLDAAAVAAVRQWEYTPTIVQGLAIPVLMEVAVNFRLQ